MEEIEKLDGSFKKQLANARRIFKKEVQPELRKRRFPGNAKRRPKRSRTEIAWPRLPLAEAVLADMRSFTLEINIAGIQIIGRTEDTFEYLIVRDTKKQQFGERWNFPGGHLLSPEEDISEAAFRECQEETHIDIRENPIVFVGLVRLRPRADATIPAYAAVFFTALTAAQRESAKKGDEQDDIKFISEYELEQMIMQRKFQLNHVNALNEYKKWRIAIPQK
mgnify:CR=1 FL=1